MGKYVLSDLWCWAAQGFFAFSMSEIRWLAINDGVYFLNNSSQLESLHASISSRIIVSMSHSFSVVKNPASVGISTRRGGLLRTSV